MARGHKPKSPVIKPPGIVCPVCGRGGMDIRDTRTGANHVKRIRLCADFKCTGRLVTVETVCYASIGLGDRAAVVPAGMLEALTRAVTAESNDETD